MDVISKKKNNKKRGSGMINTTGSYMYIKKNIHKEKHG